ncbi:MAG: lipoyl synthase [bacterium]|nr:lipoyl synthase [bacterium]
MPVLPKVKVPAGARVTATRELLARMRVHTVCQEADCPNRWECFGNGTATFLILGARCTRRCRFCHIQGGPPELVDPDEPRRVAETVAELGLRYVVVTSVTRDDLPDGGAGQFAAVIAALRARVGDVRIEVLTPDFGGDPAALDTVLAAGPNVFNHNIETVARLTPQLRDKASYLRSLAVLAYVHHRAPEIPVKSGLMVGAGEQPGEVRATLQDLRRAGCSLVSIGQYFAPSPAHHPVIEEVSEKQFARYRAWAEELGFRGFAIGPMVRSSYHAAALHSSAILPY